MSRGGLVAAGRMCVLRLFRLGVTRTVPVSKKMDPAFVPVFVFLRVPTPDLESYPPGINMYIRRV
jgi:hypothetical protein